MLPSFCTLSLESMDEQTDTHHVMITADKNESSIFFDLSGVPLRQLFTCKIFAYRCTDDSSLLAAFDLSKFL